MKQILVRKLLGICFIFVMFITLLCISSNNRINADESFDSYKEETVLEIDELDVRGYETINQIVLKYKDLANLATYDVSLTSLENKQVLDSIYNQAKDEIVKYSSSEFENYKIEVDMKLADLLNNRPRNEVKEIINQARYYVCNCSYDEKTNILENLSKLDVTYANAKFDVEQAKEGRKLSASLLVSIIGFSLLIVLSLLFVLWKLKFLNYKFFNKVFGWIDIKISIKSKKEKKVDAC